MIGKLFWNILAIILLISLTSAQPTTSDSCVQYNNNFSTCQKCLQGFNLLIYFCIPCAPLCRCQNQTNYCSSCLTIPDQLKDVVLLSYMNGGRCYFCNQTILHCLQCQLLNQESGSLALASSVSQNKVSINLTCLKCFQGYYLLANGSCSSEVCDKHCQICSSSTQCSQCVAGHALNQTSKHCSKNKCMQNCLNCTSDTTCSQCQLGYFPNSTNLTCQQCHKHCMICKNNKTCQACFPSFSYNGTHCVNNSSPNCLVYSQGASNCLICQPGYYNSGGSCNQCFGCLLCSSAFVCYSECQAGYTPFNYACIPNFSAFCMPRLVLLALIMIFCILFI